ncbi:MAG: hypothetical protein GY771_07875, partial [bacterium]|nr:hypothetical protein [bacterium]
IPAKNSLIVIDNLDSNLGYDITKKVRSDVNTILNFTRVNYDDAERAIDDIRQYSISLGNDFTYKPSLDTTMSLGFLVRKNSNDYVNNVDKSYENVDRDLTASISHEFGRLADVSVGSTISYDYTNFLGNALSNSRTDTFELNPSVYSEFSETLSSTINFDFNRITKWNPKGDAIESWKQTYDYTTNLSVIYSPFDKFTINLSMGTGHKYRLEHKTFRVKKSEDDDYYNVSLNASYEW